MSSQVRTHAPPELEVRGSFGREERCTCEGSVCEGGSVGRPTTLANEGTNTKKKEKEEKEEEIKSQGGRRHK